ncbi:MAG: hydrolase, TatD family [Francisellaceae bacterium]|nr:hydrolase, TatD family [Francisellaceae bacterium]
MFVDSHCHLQLIDCLALKTDISDIIQQAFDEGLLHLLCVATELEHTQDILNLCHQHPNISGSVGLHPNHQCSLEPSIEQLSALANHPKIVAIGETGLDFYRDEIDKNLQIQRFANHIEVAKMLNKPLIIHTRQAKLETIQTLKQEKADQVGGVIHCFTEDWDTAQQAMDLNFYISFSGIVTFKNAHNLQEVAKNIPLDRMLIETDSPYLAPVPYRGKINLPHYVKYVAEFIANLRGISLEELGTQTSENYFKLFNPS